MDDKLYKDILQKIHDFKGLSLDCLEKITEDFPSVNRDSLASILSYEFQNRMKAYYSKSERTKIRYWESYLRSIKNLESPGIIVNMGRLEVIAPCLIAKLILEKYFEYNPEPEIDDSEDDKENSHIRLLWEGREMKGLEDEYDKKKDIDVNLYLRNTSIIPDMDLAYEVFLCTKFDNLYSPSAEVIRSSSGQQYEIKLYKQIKAMQLPFRDEEYLRLRGYDKTPDILLEVPIAINNFIVNWVESKAVFGSEEIHREYMTNQYLSYWNRFGTGLVIYWFSHMKSLEDMSRKYFIIMDHFPTEVSQIGK